MKRIGNKYRVVAFGAGGQQSDRRADQFLDIAHILDCLSRKLAPAPCAGRGSLPAFERLVDGLDPRLLTLPRRKIIDHFAVEFVAGANLDLLEAIEDIELCERDPADAVIGNRLAHQHRVEPAATALAPGNRPELVTALAQELPDFILLFCREGPLADARRVRLGDAKHIMQGAGANARTCGSLP